MEKHNRWLLFILLCIIWGSSFILMKLGMFASTGKSLLSPFQVASLRILTSGIILLPFAAGAYRKIPGKDRGLVLVSGWLGSFIPAILFCMAEQKISSALAGTLNAATPLSTLIVGWVLYRIPVAVSRFLGIMIGFGGCALLFLLKKDGITGNNLFGLMVLLATLCYGWNAHLVKQRLEGVSSLDIASLAFSGLIPFSLIILWFTGYFSLNFEERDILKASGAATLLGVLGTAIASILFYRLVKTAGPLFASLVTYGIPFVAIGWGYVYGETIGLFHLGALFLILMGVYLAQKK